MIDAQSSVYIASHIQFASSSFSGSQKEYSKTFTVSSSDSIKRISLAFLQYVTSSKSNHSSSTTVNDKPLADLDLTVYRKKSDGTWTFVSSSLTNRNNVEIVQINNPTAGQYKLVVKRYDKNTSRVYFGVAWW